MTSVHLSQPAQGDSGLLNSLTSSATLYVTSLYNSKDSAADSADMMIAQGLLRADGPQVPNRHSSFTHPIHGLQNPTSQGDPSQLEPDVKSKARHSRQAISSNTWTSSSGDGTNDGDYNDRMPYVLEYNRLAVKYGIQPIVPEELVSVSVNHTSAFPGVSGDNKVVKADDVTSTAKQSSWIVRKLLRRASSIQSTKHRSDKHIKHNRSISDLSIRMNLKKDALKGKDLEELVRLCGTSALYLPPEYAAATLAVPTCFRATAQYLVQHGADSRGIFRIPGSHNTINALYNHYATQDVEGEVINGTVRCPTLPEHIPCNVHDVASAFKKFLAGLPGGILGRTWLFDAFLSIYSQLDATAELTRTKQSKVRARLVALAIACIALRCQRELICAVIGLLSMIGRAAETAPREDEHGRPLPTSDLMGYKALGIVFGPLLIGELLDNHYLYPSGPHGLLTFIQRSPPKSSKGKQRKTKTTEDSNILIQNTDKIKVINSITEMLITHWRDVVRQMKNLGVLRPGKENYGQFTGSRPAFLHPSVSETFFLRKPPEWSMEKTSVRQRDWNRSPTPSSRNEQRKLSPSELSQENLQHEGLLVMKRRSRPRPLTSQILSNSRSMSILSPTKEESFIDSTYERLQLQNSKGIGEWNQAVFRGGARKSTHSTQTFHTTGPEPTSKADQRYLVRIMSSPGSEQIQKEMVYEKSKGEFDTKQHNETSISVEQELLPSCMTSLTENVIDGSVSNRCADVGGPHNLAGTSSEVPNYFKRSKYGHTLFQEPRTLASVERSRGILKEQKPSLIVPLGIVSERLGRIATKNSCGQPSSNPRPFPQGTNIDHMERIRRPHIGLSSFQSFGSHKTDPLARVSYEEDLASLASLAKELHSQDDIMTASPPSNSKPIQYRSTHADAVKDQNTTSPCTVIGNTSAERFPGNKIVNEKERKPNLIQKSPFKRDKVCETPRKDAVDSNAQGRRVGSSVRTLAAKFDNPNSNPNPSFSPIKNPDPRQIYGHHSEPSLVSSYTVNASPISWSQKSNTSIRSLQAVQDLYPTRRHPSLSQEKSRDTTSSLPPKHLFAVVAPQNDNTPRQVAQSHLHMRSPRTDPILAHNWRSKTAHARVPSTSHKTQNGPLDVPMSRKVRLEKLPPGLELELVKRAKLVRQLSVPQIFHSPSTLELASAGPVQDATISRRLPTNSIAYKQPDNRSTSMLYSQIQRLQRQLEAKTEEAEQLRRQFLNKRNLNESNMLREQLRQSEKDLAFWRNRAEAAEKLLATPSYLVPREDLEAFACCKIPDSRNLEQFDDRNEGFQHQKRVGHSIQVALQNLPERDDIKELPGSEGTLRRTNPKQPIISEGVMDSCSDGKSHQGKSS